MFQYLLNTTAIWLMSLVLFDAFLRRESYHAYNRFYLLFTLLLGALLPLWQWQDTGRVYAGTLQAPLQQVVTVKQNVVAAATPATTVSWVQWLAIIYWAGVFIALGLLVIEIIKLVGFYRKGKKTILNGWTIIETGKEHAPFSFLDTLYVCSRQQYSDGEWNMILTHEKRHGALFHFADLLLMQVARIIFWFHPLVYIYNKRLLLIHEYQADTHIVSLGAAEGQQVYGKFLVEQALLQSAPSISHSFNRSPIKKRIIMLTRRSSAASRTKMLVFIPLALVCMICFSKNVFSQKNSGSDPFLLAFGNKNLGINRTTLNDVLANPSIYVNQPGYEILDFSIYLLPAGKDLVGPYKIKGNTVDGTALDKIKELSKTDTGNGRIFIDDVHVKHNGKTDAIMGINIKYDYHKKFWWADAHLITFGIADPNTHVITLNQILDNPTVICKEANYTVVKFSIMFSHTVKNDVIGPFTINGSQVGGEALEKIKELNKSKDKGIRIFVSEVHAESGGKDGLVPSNIFYDVN